MDKIKESILKFALQNGVKFDKVNQGAVISKVIGEHPSVKDKLKELQSTIKETIELVNEYDKDERIEKLKQIAPELLEEKKHEVREGLKDLPNVHGKVVLRAAPSPSGPMHIGHAYTFGLNYQYKKQYNGKFILRIEDTNADNIELEAYTMIPEDFAWYTDNGIDEVIIQSDRMELYYDYAIKLLDEGFAYICTCPSEVFKEKLDRMTPCDCRKLSVEDNLKRWHKMLTSYKEGDAVMRFKSDIEDKNPAMRDFPLIRINESEHPRQGKKYKVWPLMNFAVSIDDMDMGITHAIRGKDHADNAKRQAMIHNALKVNTPEAVSVGRINFEGFDLSTTQTKARIKEQMYTGWDDIRLPFLRALKRRGYQAAALRKFAVSMGITLTDKTVSQEEFVKTLNSFNKEIIDPIANRYFAILDPIKIVIENAPELEFEQDLHPETKKGGRKFITHNHFFIEKDDFKDIKENEVVRLMGCLNFTKKGNALHYVSKEYQAFKEIGKKQIHWLPVNDAIKISIMLENGKTADAIAEKDVEHVAVNHIVQFERFGFCRCDSNKSFWFTHR